MEEKMEVIQARREGQRGEGGRDGMERQGVVGWYGVDEMGWGMRAAAKVEDNLEGMSEGMKGPGPAGCNDT